MSNNFNKEFNKDFNKGQANQQPGAQQRPTGGQGQQRPAGTPTANTNTQKGGAGTGKFDQKTPLDKNR